MVYVRDMYCEHLGYLFFVRFLQKNLQGCPPRLCSWIYVPEYMNRYSFDTTEQYKKGSPKIVVNVHVLRNHGDAKNLNQ